MKIFYLYTAVAFVSINETEGLYTSIRALDFQTSASISGNDTFFVAGGIE